MKTNNLQWLAPLLATTLMCSCLNDLEHIENSAPPSTNASEKITKLGRQLENPYSVSNMQRALDSLHGESKRSMRRQGREHLKVAKGIGITTTDLYVRFLPKDSLELYLIEQDSTLHFYDYPLDFEIEEQGDFYHDTELPEDQITWQYTVVKPSYEFPDVRYEILAELFIPENSEAYDTTTEKTPYTNTYYLDKLETLSLYLTNNVSKEERQAIEKSKKDQSFLDRTARSRWRPSGTIRLWDDKLEKFVAMQGVEVRARRWFKTRKGISDANGEFSCRGKFKRRANYSIKWKRHRFAIKSSWWLVYSGTARYNGPKKKGSWQLDIKGGFQQYCATIFQAAYDYYYRHNFGLRKPAASGGFWRMRIRARKKNGKSSHVQARRIWNGSDISLKAWGDPSDLVYGTTIHELAHAAHKNIDPFSYVGLVTRGYTIPCTVNSALDDCNQPTKRNSAEARRVLETWATTVEIVLTQHRYRNYLGDSSYDYYYNNRQDYPINSQPFYTSVGYDLIDNINQSKDIYKNYIGAYPQDRVSGYTIKQIENSLKNTNSWGEWKEHIKQQNPNNPTNEYIDELFNNW